MPKLLLSDGNLVSKLMFLNFFCNSFSTINLSIILRVLSDELELIKITSVKISDCRFTNSNVFKIYFSSL